MGDYTEILQSPAFITAVAIMLVFIGLLTLRWYRNRNKPSKEEILKNEEQTEIVEEIRDGEVIKVARPVGKYPAMIISDMGIMFSRIPTKKGTAHFLEPSMPEHGAHLLVVKDDKGEYIPYDPKEAPLLARETPQIAYRAINWDIARRVYAYKIGGWEQINKILIVVIIIGAFFVAMMYAPKG